MASAAAPKNTFPHTWCVYLGLVGLLLLQLGLSLGLYNYILTVERRFETDIDRLQNVRRAKRAVGDENVVDEANVEFFHPNLRQELEEKDAARKAASPGKMSKDNKDENPWLYLTSYSRVPNTVDSGGTLSNSWTSLKPLVNNILVGHKEYELFEWGYYQAFRAVFFGQGAQLYKLLEAEISEHLISQLQKRIGALEGMPLQTELTKMWSSHKHARSLLSKVFHYCDKKFVAENKLLSISEMCDHLFRTKVVMEPRLEGKLKAALAMVVKECRKGRVFDHNTLRPCCKMLIELDQERAVYESVFEQDFLQKTRQFYSLEAQILLKSTSCIEYVAEVELLIAQEIAMCNTLLDTSTETHLREVLHEILIANQIDKFMDSPTSGVLNMLKKSDVKGLSKVYTTLTKVTQGPSAMARCMSSFLRERGSQIVNEPEGPLTTHGAFAITFVQRLIELKDFVDRLLHQAFGDDIFLKRSTNLDFEHFINANQRSPEYLSLFIDDKLRKSEKVAGKMMDEDMAKALVVFRFLREKDMFERYYKQHLAKRLLLKKSTNQIWEQNMVLKLKAECGFQFTQNLEAMFKDMAYSDTLMDAFKSAVAEKNKDEIDVDVKVLSPNNWPVNFPPPACTLPPFAAEAFAKYEQFYLQRHQHRKLLVSTMLGGAEVLAHFYGEVPFETHVKGPRRYYLSVATQQMVILDLFNKTDRLTVAELLEKTGLSEHDLIKNLTPMVFGKVNQQILTKSPAAKDILPDDVFKINDSYHSKSLRARLHPVASRVESVSERHKTRSLVEVDRKSELEAALVRIMKEAKTLHQNALIAKVIEQVKHRFAPTPGDIKKSIDCLCSREFLERTESDRSFFMQLFSEKLLVATLGAIQEFCEAALKNCPPGPIGPTGLPGINGEKGDRGERGDRGFPGDPGVRGPPGASGEHGHKGHKGESGWPGTPGLDGRDGIPGEPGLDGIPGRNGMDGIPGIDGKHGFNGDPGLPGLNGTNGKPGLMGPQGPPGPRGPQGIAGPRGRPGKGGQDGTPGLPGISAWMVNGAKANELLIPPSIAGGSTLINGKAIVVHEGVNVRLRCAASGQPKPDVEWYRLTNATIPLGSWQAVSATGHTFNIPKINREHMGIYRCIANNGVPPQANQTFAVEVHFPPLIRIHRQTVSAYNNSTARLECEVEAFPEALRYWERADGRLLENGDKYRITVIEIGKYRARMQLNITKINSHDYGRYHCISKNELGQTTGVFTVFEVDPRLATPPPIGSQGMTVIGQMPPEHKSMDDLCPAPVCPECAPEPPTKGKCTDGGLSLFDLIGRMEIRQFGNETYPGLPNRTFDCILYAVGKPVFHRFTDKSYGSWMRDPHPKNDVMADKYWVTKEEDNNHLFEYANKAQYRKNTPSRNYTLNPPFMGNSFVMHNGSFYYNQKNRPNIIRFDLSTEAARSVELPQASSTDNNKLFDRGYNYVDLSVDENGLWAVYGLPENNNTVVVKMDAFTLKREYSWNISVDHHKVGEMFIVCGVLYAVDSVTDRDTKIRFALDLYKNMLLDVSLPFTNPFRKTTMISYNARSKELFTWDKGNQLTYPVRYHDSGYNSTKEDKNDSGSASAHIQTGYEVEATSEAPYADNPYDV